MTTALRFSTKKCILVSSLVLTAVAMVTAGSLYTVNAQQPTPALTLTPLPVTAPTPTPTPTGKPAAANLVTPDGQLLTDIPSNVTLTAIPPRLGDDGELKAKPGEKIQTTIRVRNASDKALPITTLVRDFIIGEDGKTPIQISSDVSNRWSLASWITVSPSTQMLQPRQTAQLSVLITVPKDALPGGHYAMILHEPSQNTNDRGENVETDPQSVIAQRVGTLVYFMVEGPINEEAFVRNLQIPQFTEYGPVPFKFTVENVSDIHIKPSITVDIMNVFGQTIDTITPDQMNVFPYVSREYTGQWDRVWGVGPYTARVTMSYGSQGKVAMASTSFWLLPYKIVAAAGVGLMTILVILLLIRRHLIHRNADEKNKIAALEQRLAELETDPNSASSKQQPTDFET